MVQFQVASEFVVGPDGGNGWGVVTEEGLELHERDSSVVQVHRGIEIPVTEGARTLRFTLETRFDESADGSLEDQVLIYLVDPSTGDTLIGNGGAGTAALSLVGREADFTAGLVQFNGSVVEMDLTELEEVDQALLVVQLVNGDSDEGSVVRLTDLMVDVEPEGEANPIFVDNTNLLPVAGALDLTALSEAGEEIETRIETIRFDTETGDYGAQLMIRNLGDERLGRQVAVVFGGLPEGVELLDPSGLDSEGNAYVNLRNTIPSGGLENGAFSDAVGVRFSNPELLRFGIQSTVLTGGANQAPVFEEVGTLDVMPGGRIEIPLVSTDADGDVVTYRIEGAVGLPKGQLNGMGSLVFQPQVDDVGSYSFTLIATDGAEEVRQEVTLNVVADPITTTRVSGVVASTLVDPETGEQLRLEGVRVTLGDVETFTAADGSFTLELLDGFPDVNTLKIHGDSIEGGYPFIAEMVPLVLGQEAIEGVDNIISRPIYLPPIDVASGQAIDPSVDMVVTTENIPGAAVSVDAGSLQYMDEAGQLQDFTGILSITEVPNELTPAALPANLLPDLVVTIQPGEMVFETPAPLTLPNVAGYNPGTLMDLYSINPETGDFEIVGVGRVSEDGSVVETISGGIRNSRLAPFCSPSKIE